MTELRRKHFVTPVDPRRNCADRYLKDTRDLLVGKLFEISEKYRHTILWLEAGNDGANFIRKLVRIDAFIERDPDNRLGGSEPIAKGNKPPRLSRLIDALVNCQTIKPSRKLRATAKSNTLEQLNKHLLRHVLRPFTVTRKEIEGDRINPPLILDIESMHCLAAAVSALGKQVCIRRVFDSQRVSLHFRFLAILLRFSLH